MTLDLPEGKWTQFFEDLSKRRFGWTTKIEVMNDSIGDQVLSEGLPLNGITIDQKGDARTIEIAVGENTAHHQSHTIANPRKIAYLDDDKNLGSIVEIEEQNGTKTLLHIIEPMPLLVSYSEYEMFSTAA